MTFVLNVVAGVIATVVVLLATAYAPRIARARGLGPRNISGKWDYFYTEDASDTKRCGNARIRQWGWHIWIDLSVEQRRDGSRYARDERPRFKAHGRWSHDEMVARFRDAGARHRMGAFIMHWRSGSILGRSIYVESDRFQVAKATDVSDWITVHSIRFSRPDNTDE